jgi:outer membrane protein TolC
MSKQSLLLAKTVSCLCSLFTFGVLSVQAQSTSEEGVVLEALGQNSQIQIEKLGLLKEELSLQSITSTAKPQASIQVPLSWTNEKTDSISIQTTSVSANAQVSQNISGGGNAGVSFFEQMKNGDIDLRQRELSVSLKQPLLKGFGKNADVFYRIHVQKNQYQMAREQFLENLASKLSDIRSNYWDWVAASALYDIRKKELEYALRELEYQRARFLIGQISQIDTLGAAIDFLRAQSGLNAAEQSEKSARRGLCLALNRKSDSLLPPQSLEVNVESIQPVQVLLLKIDSTSTVLKILKISQDNLNRQLSYNRNRLWPSLDATASYSLGEIDDPLVSSTNNASVGLLLSFDLFRYNERVSKKISEHDVAISKIKEESTRKELQAQLYGLFDNWKGDSLQFAIQSAEVEMAQKRYDVILQEEKLGAVDALTRQKAKNDLIEAQIGKLEKAITLKKIEITLDLSTKNIFQKFRLETP